MTDRKAIGVKLRFEVFKRDSFTCQYCGAKAPDVVLECDHMQPVAEGGTNDIMNLITSCKACNGGKGARALSDQSVLERQRAQMADLEERRAQLEMMMDWKNGLADLSVDNAAALEQYFCKLVGWGSFNEYGKGQVAQWLRKYSVADVMSGIDAAVAQYVVSGNDGKPTSESVTKAFHMVGKIANVRAGARDKPYLKDLLYVRGILRNRFTLSPQAGAGALADLESAYHVGVTVHEMKALAKSEYSFRTFVKALAELMDEREG